MRDTWPGGESTQGVTKAGELSDEPKDNLITNINTSDYMTMAYTDSHTPKKQAILFSIDLYVAARQPFCQRCTQPNGHFLQKSLGCPLFRGQRAAWFELGPIESAQARHS